MSTLVTSMADMDRTFLQAHRVVCLFSGGLDGTYLFQHIHTVWPSATVLALGASF